MDGQTDEWRDRQMNGGTDRRKDSQMTDIWMGIQMDKQTDAWTDKLMELQTNIYRERRTDGWSPGGGRERYRQENEKTGRLMWMFTTLISEQYLNFLFQLFNCVKKRSFLKEKKGETVPLKVK